MEVMNRSVHLEPIAAGQTSCAVQVEAYVVIAFVKLPA